MDVACQNDTDDNGPSSFIVYVIRVDRQAKDVTYFHASSSEFFIAKNAHIPENMQAPSLLSLRFSPSSGRALFSPLSEVALHSYLNRSDYAFPGRLFDSTVLRSLLLGTRVQDYLQSAATVVNVKPLVVRIPRRPHLQDILIGKVRFITEAGQLLQVIVDDIKEAQGYLSLACSPLGSTPRGLVKNSRLLLYDETYKHMSPAQAILEQCYLGIRPVVNRNLLDRLYGVSHSHAYAGVTRRLISIKKQGGKECLLSPAQSEALRRYQACPAFAVCGPPGSGKTLVATAMATSYCAEGNQLVLVPTPQGLAALAQALVALDTTNKAFVLLGEDGAVERIHGSELLDMKHGGEIDQDSVSNSGGRIVKKKMDADVAHSSEVIGTRSKFGGFFWELDSGRNEIDTDPQGETHNDTFKKTMKEEGTVIPELKMRRTKTEGLIILSTVDTVLKMMANQIRKDGSKGEGLQSIMEEKETTHAQQLLSGVTKIIIDEANQLAEPSLVALTQCFPGLLTIAVIGDARQLLPKTFDGPLSSQLAGSHALDLFQRKLNVPSIQMAETHRHCKDVMPYSELFYGIPIPTTRRRRSDRFRLNVLSNDIDRNCLLVEAPGWKARQVGEDSWINDVEINALVFTLKKLREAGKGSIMVICLYEAQRQLALATIPNFYEVMTVEEAQGREADIVIVLTTMDKLTVDLPFMCPNRCNVATSRHREALIIMGKQKLLTKFDPWSGLFEQECFDVTYCDYEKGIFTDLPKDC